MRDAIQYGYQTGIRHWRIAAIVYFFQFCLALTLGMQVYEVLKASIGHSLEINKLVMHYDHTVMTDFLKVHGASITPLIGQLRWLLLTWLVFSIFIDGGIIFTVSSPQQSASQSFWLGGARYFFPFLKTSLVFLCMALGWTALIFVPFIAFLEPSLHYFTSEQYTVWLAILLVFIWLLGLAWLFVWSILSRLQHLKGGDSIFSSIRKGWQVLRKNKGLVTGLSAVFIGAHIILLSLYLMLELSVGMTSPVLILLFFLVQQVFVFLRVMLRVMMYGGMSQI